MTDAQMLHGIQASQQESMEAFMRKYRRYVYTVIANILGSFGSREDIEELLQDTFFSIWRHAEGISPHKLKAYLGTTARNRAKSFLRSHKELPMAADTVEIPDPGDSLEDAAVQAELCQRLRRAIARMRPKDREIFLRHYYYLQNTAEIAELMNMPRNTVLTRLARGRKLLQKTLNKEESI